MGIETSGTGADDTDAVAVKLWHDRNGDGSLDGCDVELGAGTYPQDNGNLLLRLIAPLALPIALDQR